MCFPPTLVPQNHSHSHALTALFHVTIRSDAAFQACASASPSPSPSSSRGIGSPSAASAKKLLNCAVLIRSEDDGDKEDDNDGDDDADGNGDPDNATMTRPEQIRRKNDEFGELLTPSMF